MLAVLAVAGNHDHETLPRLAAALLPPDHWAGNPDLQPVAYDPQRARGLLREAGCTMVAMGVQSGSARIRRQIYGRRESNEAIVEAGGPANLVCAVAEPTIETAQGIMGHPDVNLLTVTGGAGVVREAMHSGKRAICAGPGNPPVVVDETADVEQAGRDIVRGASFDNNIICVDEKEVIVVESVAEALKSEKGGDVNWVEISTLSSTRLERSTPST